MRFFCCLSLACLLSLHAGASPNIIEVSNGELTLQIERHGGHFTRLGLSGHTRNPLSWALSSEQMPPNNRGGAPFKGHFLCLGRWGSPSDGEIKSGIPHNGEPSNTWWTVEELSPASVSMRNDAPLDGLEVERKVELIEGASVFVVTEVYTNTFSLGRVSNVVQHVTIGPPFLSKRTLINCNAGQGFNQKFSFPNPHSHQYHWPLAITDAEIGQRLDLRLSDTEHNLVSTHIFPPGERYGWITAYDPESGLLMGYFWQLSDYPWINLWKHFENGEPAATGLEFGTTGIGRPYRELLETETRFHGVNSWEYIDAGESVQKTFAGFLVYIGKSRPNPDLVIGDDAILIDGQRAFSNPL